MNNVENLYQVIKNFLPLAGNYLKGTSIEPYLPQIQGVINWIESLGGIQTISNLLQGVSAKNNTHASALSAPTPQPQSLNFQPHPSSTNGIRNIDSYPRI